MSRDAFDALLSLITIDQTYQHPAHPPDARPVITIARDHGAGGEAIAGKVAERLGLHCFDREILEAILKTATGDPHLMRALDETLPAYSGTFLYAALMGLNDPLTEYQSLLLRMVNGIAQQGGVIVGRGAHLLVRGPRRLRVRIVGSDEVCARRLAAGDDTQVQARLSEVRKTNAARAEYVRKIYHADNADPLAYDLVINTDRFADLDAVADLITTAAKAAKTHADQSATHHASTIGP